MLEETGVLLIAYSDSALRIVSKAVLNTVHIFGLSNCAYLENYPKTIKYE